MRVEMKDGLIMSTEPKGLVGYTSVPFREWAKDWPYSLSTMNLFRSGDHVRNWSGFKSGTEEGIVELLAVAKLFSIDLFRKRLDPDYFSHIQEYRNGLIAALEEMGGKSPFWLPRVP